MTAILTSGKYFGATEQVTSDKLHQIVESATFLNLGLSEITSGSSVVQVSATAPSDTTRPWYDTTLGLLRIYDGSAWGNPGCLILNNASTAVVAGDIVCVSTGTDNSFAVTTTANNTRVIGVALEAISNGASGLIRTSGRVTVNIKSDTYTSSHIWLSTSTTSGKGQLTTTAAEGVCGSVIRQPATDATSAICVLWGQPAL